MLLPRPHCHDCTPWTDAPLSYSDWAKLNRGKSELSERIWAYWVFDLPKNSSPADLKKRYLKLSANFHLDRNPEGLETMKIINQAADILGLNKK